LSVDPLSSSYPWYSPYQFAGNKPIIAIDIDGLEELCVNDNTSPTEPNSISESIPQATNKEVCNESQNNFSIENNSSNNNRQIIISSSYTEEVSSHSFEWETDDEGKSVGNDVIHTNQSIRTQVIWSDSKTTNTKTYITFHTIIDRDGKSNGVTMNYWSNSGGANGGELNINSQVNLNNAPDNFKLLYNAAYNYKNAKSTRQTNFIQTIAKNNLSNNKDISTVKTIANVFTTGLSYSPHPAGKLAATIIGGISTLDDLTGTTTSETDPTKIVLRLPKVTN
jgi:hypothetical protein